MTEKKSPVLSTQTPAYPSLSDESDRRAFLKLIGKSGVLGTAGLLFLNCDDVDAPASDTAQGRGTDTLDSDSSGTDLSGTDSSTSGVNPPETGSDGGYESIDQGELPGTMEPGVDDYISDTSNIAADSDTGANMDTETDSSSDTATETETAPSTDSDTSLDDGIFLGFIE